MTSDSCGLNLREGRRGAALRAFVRRFAARRGWSVAFVGLLALTISAGLSALRFPVPRIHDEFSYLLAADTFAHGRLSNPTPPVWPNLETFHVLLRPRYASKYPPLQAAFLAAGQRLTGRPVVGVWLSVALGCAGVCWMLQGWTRPRWALLGGILAAVHHGIHGGLPVPVWGSNYSWSQSYWGGGVAMLGGALVLGSMPRLLRRPTPGVAALLGLGLVVLANTRPFEGLLVSLPVLLVLGYRGASSARWLRVVLPPASAVLAAGMGMTAAVNQSTTGAAWRMPYGVYEASYNPAPLFNFQAMRTPTDAPYRHNVIRRYFTGWSSDQIFHQRTWPDWWQYQRERLDRLGAFFVGPLVLPLLTLPFLAPRRAVAFVALDCGLVVGLHLMTFGILPHYAAPAAAGFFFLVVEGLRRLARIRFAGQRIGQVLVALTLVLVVVKLASVTYERAVSSDDWADTRANLASRLAASGERHLVLVRYRPDHDVHHEWVYNEADVERAPVVWARETDDVSTVELTRAFPGRTVWRLEADRVPIELQPLPGDFRPDAQGDSRASAAASKASR